MLNGGEIKKERASLWSDYWDPFVCWRLKSIIMKAIGIHAMGKTTF